MAESHWSPEPGEILTVSDLLGRVRGALEGTFAWVWVEAELSNTRIPTSGHAYFTLKDESCQLRAVCFRSVLRLLRVIPADGLRVLVRGRLTVYEARGDVQLVVEDMEPEGEGALRLEFEALKRKLSSEGLFAEERKRELPLLPRRVGVVTSPSGAAIRDILQVLERRAPGVPVVLAPARVQGDGAVAELIAALELVCRAPEVDVVILGRGGGAAEDLWAFNAEGLVRAVVASPVPVIAAIGHEIDVTLCDLAADLRAPTPSAGAELAVREWARWGEAVVRARERLEAACTKVLHSRRSTLERLDPFVHSPAHRLDRTRVRVDRSLEGMAASLGRRLLREASGVRRLETKLSRAAPLVRLKERRGGLQELTARLATACGRRLAGDRRALAVAEGRLGALNPLAVLERGYAIVRDQEGAVLRDASGCQPGDGVAVRLHRGELSCRVTGVTPPQGEG